MANTTNSILDEAIDYLKKMEDIRNKIDNAVGQAYYFKVEEKGQKERPRIKSDRSYS